MEQHTTINRTGQTQETKRKLSPVPIFYSARPWTRDDYLRIFDGKASGLLKCELVSHRKKGSWIYWKEFPHLMLSVSHWAL